MLVILALERWRQEDHKFEATLGCEFKESLDHIAKQTAFTGLLSPLAAMGPHFLLIEATRFLGG